MVCTNPNCESKGIPITPVKKGELHENKIPLPGVRPKGYGPKTPEYVIKNRPLAASKQAGGRGGRGRKVDEDHAEHDKDTVKEEYLSDEFRMCADPKRKIRKNVDVRKEEIMRSCLDLEMDG